MRPGKDTVVPEKDASHRLGNDEGHAARLRHCSGGGCGNPARCMRPDCRVAMLFALAILSRCKYQDVSPIVRVNGLSGHFSLKFCQRFFDTSYGFFDVFVRCGIR
jgi:hypothetical protein